MGHQNPLVVIDGLPRSQTDFNQLDANEIESVTILKDASSSSLYGIQGANGVIVVTTKRGVDREKTAYFFYCSTSGSATYSSARNNEFL